MLKESIKQDCVVAESPIWSQRGQCFYWVDVGKQTVHKWQANKDLSGTAHQIVHLPFVFSAIFEGADNKLYLVAEHQVLHFDFTSANTESIIHCEQLDQEHRFNDAKVDAKGRLWLGSMNKTLQAPSGHLYSFEKNQTIQQKDKDFIVSNGLSWSPNNKVMYVVETVSRTIYQYNFNLKSGEVSNKMPLIIFDETQGKPDGITIDKNGNIWVAMWDGWAVLRVNPKGDIIDTIQLPVARPTSVTFGGELLNTLLITTASYGLTPEALEQYPYSGSILSYQTHTQGLTANLFR